jgi:hypothetical protein
MSSVLICEHAGDFDMVSLKVTVRVLESLKSRQVVDQERSDRVRTISTHETMDLKLSEA